jgi:hypothetical protein
MDLVLSSWRCIPSEIWVTKWSSNMQYYSTRLFVRGGEYVPDGRPVFSSNKNQILQIMWPEVINLSYFVNFSLNDNHKAQVDHYSQGTKTTTNYCCIRNFNYWVWYWQHKICITGSLCVRNIGFTSLFMPALVERIYIQKKFSKDCDAAQSHGWMPIFWCNMLPPSSGLKCGGWGIRWFIYVAVCLHSEDGGSIFLQVSIHEWDYIMST